MEGPQQSPKSGGNAKQLILILHGLGADGYDLIDLAPVFAEYLPDAHFISPHAPFPCDMAPMGRQWFSLQQWTEEAMIKGLDTVAPLLNAFIDEQLTRFGLSEEALGLVGFSQGTMTSLHVGLRRAKPCGAIVGYSGALVAPYKLEKELQSRPPVCLIHGNMDMVVPYVALQASATALEHYTVPVEQHTRLGLAHSIDMQGMKIGGEFLKKHLMV